MVIVAPLGVIPLVTLHVSVWVEIHQLRSFSAPTVVTLHVSVWVEIRRNKLLSNFVSRHAPRERVSWNQSLLLSAWTRPEVTLHVSVWVEIISVSVISAVYSSHAPRERVSWNVVSNRCILLSAVTLHVSVWVEIGTMLRNWNRASVTLHVSVWVEIPSMRECQNVSRVTLHVSVWVEIWKSIMTQRALSSRSTWACELKYHRYRAVDNAGLSRSTWACELKLARQPYSHIWLSHAPRERVSWNADCLQSSNEYVVTLHVSVWVEMLMIISIALSELSRSTWACELKW